MRLPIPRSLLQHPQPLPQLPSLPLPLPSTLSQDKTSPSPSTDSPIIFISRRSGPAPPANPSDATQHQGTPQSTILSICLIIAAVIIISIAVWFMKRISPLIENPYYHRIFGRHAERDRDPGLYARAGIRYREIYVGPTHLRPIYEERERMSRKKGLLDREVLNGFPVAKFEEMGVGKSRESRHGVEKTVVANSETRIQDLERGKGQNKTSMADELSSPETATQIQARIQSEADIELNSSICCTVCTEAFEADDEIRILPCWHFYHQRCIDPWLLKYSGTCPVCRVLLKDGIVTPAPLPAQPSPIRRPMPARIAVRLRPYFHAPSTPNGGGRM